MKTLTKAKKPARKSVRKIAVRKPVKTLPSWVGCVSIGAPSDKDSRRRHMRARIYADNHN